MPTNLVTFLRSQQTYQGVPVKNLKDGWNGYVEAIDKLEKSKNIVVLRTKKENAPRYV
jgi:transcription initiation factor TFIIE subunit beta